MLFSSEDGGGMRQHALHPLRNFTEDRRGFSTLNAKWLLCFVTFDEP